jgi:sugar O-acyltransferase (sialic acid O-acetyltransferase NeuD family)
MRTDGGPIVIYGCGGFAREVLSLIQDINAAGASWEVQGFVDDDPSLWGRTINGFRVVEGREWLTAAVEPPSVAFGLGSPATKAHVAVALASVGMRYPSLVHPSVVMSRRVTIGEGVVITAGNILTTEIALGDLAMLNLSCTVGHDCTIGKFVAISPGANVSGNVTIGEGCDIGTGAAVIQGVSIGEWSVVGAGAVVARNLPSNCTAVGVPAKLIKSRERGWQLESSSPGVRSIAGT